MISKSHSEHAANKPIVKCSVEGMKCAVLFDSGAEINVIDKEFLCQIQKLNPRIKFVRKMGRLNCANGSPLNVLGEASFELIIGLKKISSRFTVVDKIFPKIIFGLRAMKKHDISIIPSRDSIRVMGIEIPFLSRTETTEN